MMDLKNFLQTSDGVDVVKVWAVVIATTGLSLADVQAIISIAATSIAIAYTLWKWYHDLRKRKKSYEKLPPPSTPCS